MTPQALPAGTTLIVAGGRVILPDTDWHRPAIADIAIAGPTIAAIAPAFAPPAGAPVETLDARGHLVLPGFVNAHYHSHDVLAKGTLEEVPLEAWRLYALPPQYPPRSLEEVRARTLLGAMYWSGEGVSRDHKEAARLYLLAANQGYARAQNDIGFMLGFEGNPPHDDVEAYKWLTLAIQRYTAKNQDRLDQAIKDRATLASRMTQAQIDEAERRAKAWRPRP